MPRGYRPNGTKLGFQKGYKMSEKGKLKMREPKSEETKKKMSQNHHHFWRGKRFPEEMKKKISKSLLGNKRSLGYKHTKEHIEKNRIGSLGKKHSDETKRKIAKSRKGIYVKEKCPAWRGGISFEPYTTDWTETLKRSIRERDNYTCQICRKEPAIYVHHIDYNKKNCNPDNLITLCQKCHNKTTWNREFWIKFFSIMKKEKRSGVKFILENGEIK